MPSFSGVTPAHRRRGRLVLAASAVVLALAGGLAYATIPDSGGVIRGCYLKTTGALRVIDTEAGASCRLFEEPLSWNQQGRPGPEGPAGPSEAFSVEAAGAEVTIPTGFTVILQRLVPAGKYAVSGNVVVANQNATGTVPVNCLLTSPDEGSPSYGARIDPFRFTSPSAPSGASVATIALAFTTELSSEGALSLVCQSNTGPGGLTALAGPRQITAIRVGALSEQDTAP